MPAKRTLNVTAHSFVLRRRMLQAVSQCLDCGCYEHMPAWTDRVAMLVLLVASRAAGLEVYRWLVGIAPNIQSQWWLFEKFCPDEASWKPKRKVTDLKCMGGFFLVQLLYSFSLQNTGRERRYTVSILRFAANSTFSKRCQSNAFWGSTRGTACFFSWLFQVSATKLDRQRVTGPS